MLYYIGAGLLNKIHFVLSLVNLLDFTTFTNRCLIRIPFKHLLRKLFIVTKAGNKMTSLTQTTFAIEIDGISSEVLLKDLRQHISSLNIEFGIPESGELTRGWLSDRIEGKINLGPSLGAVIIILGNFLIANYQLSKVSHSSQSRAIEILIKLDNEDLPRRIDVASFPKSIPDDFNELPIECLKTISVDK